MENKEVKKANRYFKVLTWLYIISAILAVVAIVGTVMGREVSASNIIWANVTILIDSALLAFICSHAELTKKEYEPNLEDSEQE